MQAVHQYDRESHAAAWGTAAHEVAEWALRNDKRCGEYPHTFIKTKSHEIYFDDEVAETAQEFVSYVRERCAHYEKETGEKPICAIEQSFSLDAIKPPVDAGGTGDTVLMFPAWKLIEIVDLKGGIGHVVNVLANKQLRTYALGAVLANPGEWDTVKSTIVQPRAPHMDGRTRSDEMTISELMDWTSDLQEAMWRAAEWLGKTEAPGFEETLTAGDHCVFCTARIECPALEKKSLEEAHVHFTPQGEATAPPAPETLRTEQIVRILDHADMIRNWLKALETYAQDQVEYGNEVKDGNSEYVLEPKRATRKWVPHVDAATVAIALGVDIDDVLSEPDVLSPAQLQKKFGIKAYRLAESFVTKQSSGNNLVRSDKTTRPAVLPPAQQFFKKEN